MSVIYNRDDRLLVQVMLLSVLLHILAVLGLRSLKDSPVLKGEPHTLSRFVELQPIKPAEEVDEIVTVELGSQLQQAATTVLEPEPAKVEMPASDSEVVSEFKEEVPPQPGSEFEPPAKPAPIPKSSPKPEPATKEVEPQAIAAKSDEATPNSMATPAESSEVASSQPAAGGSAPAGENAAHKNTSPTGTASGHGASSGDDGIDKSALRRGYIGQLGLRINRKYFYPKIAQRLGQQGRVLVAIKINATGRIVDVSFHKKCEHKLLNDAAIEALQKLRSVPAPPAALLASGHIRVIVPMVYSL